MCYDPSIFHRQTVRLCEGKMEAIKQERPKDYWKDKEWNRLDEQKKISEIRIREVERMKKQGIKF